MTVPSDELETEILKQMSKQRKAKEPASKYFILFFIISSH